MSKEIKVGLLVIITLVIAIFGFQFLKRATLSGNTYYTVYDNVEGLYTSSPVFSGGVNVGKVGKITIMPNSGGQILVEIILDDKVEVPVSSVAEFRTDLFGEASIALLYSDSTSMYQPGDTIIGNKSAGMIGEAMEIVNPVLGDLSNVLGKLDTTLGKINGMFPEEGEEAPADLYETVNLVNAQLESLTETTDRVNNLLEKNSRNLTTMVDDLTEVTGEMADNKESIGAFLANIEVISGDLAESDLQATIEGLNGSLGELEVMLASINEGEGTVGKLINDPVTYQKLEAIMNSMDALLVDFKANPDRYVSLSLIERRNK